MKPLPAAAYLAASQMCVAVAGAAYGAATTNPVPPPSRQINQLYNDLTTGDPPTLDEYGNVNNVTGSHFMSAAPMPAGHIDPVPIEDYLRTLQRRFPHFRYIVHRLPDVGDDGGPRLPTMDTTDLTLGEFVNYVNQNCPGVQIKADESASNIDPLYVVTLSPPTVATAAPPRAVRAVSVRAAVQVQQRVRHEDERAALNDVMSLVQAMADASPAGRSAKLKVHEPTSMLIFDGPAPLADAVSSAVDAMAKLTPDQQRILTLDEDQQQDEAALVQTTQASLDFLQSQYNLLRLQYQRATTHDKQQQAELDQQIQQFKEAESRHQEELRQQRDAQFLRSRRAATRRSAN